MSPLVCLTAKKVKNKFIELMHKPFKLIVTLGFILVLVMNFSLSEYSASSERPLQEFKAIIFVFYLICFITETNKGFHSGGTMFTMADVNLLFMSPVKPVNILFHGMLSRLGSSLLMGTAFIYQFALLRSVYPIKAGDMLTAVVGYGTVVFVSQVVGMLIYFYTCGEKSKIKKARAFLYSVYTCFLLVCLVRFVTSGNLTLSGMARVVTALPMRFFPVAGWIFTAVDGFMLSDMLKISAGVIPSAAFIAVAFAIIAFSGHGYYEDVLLSAERGSDNKVQDGALLTQVHSEVGKLKKGRGASVVFYKHLIENRRTKTSFITPVSLFYLVFIGVYGVVLKSDYVSLFTLSCTVSITSVLSGRWIKEITMPHIYLIPEPATKKLFFMLPELLPKIITESLLQCALIGFITRLGAVTVAAMFFSRLTFCFVFTASALIVARLFREREKNNVFAAASIFVGCIFSVPAAVVCYVLTGYAMGMIIGFIAMGVINMAVSVLLLFFARKLLEFTE